MIILGQDHWYLGIKQAYLYSDVQFDFFGIKKFNYSGLWSTNIVVGGIVGTNVRLMPEINVIILRGGDKPILVPAIGVQVVL
jgi:hypothetical protein